MRPIKGLTKILHCVYTAWQTSSFRSTCVGGVTVSMVAFQAVDPGSTPGRRSENFLKIKFIRSIFDSLLFTLFNPS